MSDVFDVRRRSLEERRRLWMWGSRKPRRGICRQMAENPTGEIDDFLSRTR
jgi:hypothetical protein